MNIDIEAIKARIRESKRSIENRNAEDWEYFYHGHVSALIAEVERLEVERDAAVKCISRNCANIEFVEGGIAYCELTGNYCNDCEHMWRGERSGK